MIGFGRKPRGGKVLNMRRGYKLLIAGLATLWPNLNALIIITFDELQTLKLYERPYKRL